MVKSPRHKSQWDGPMYDDNSNVSYDEGQWFHPITSNVKCYSTIRKDVDSETVFANSESHNISSGSNSGEAFPWHQAITWHYTDVIMTTMASQITSLMVVYSTVYSDADQSKHQSSASLAFVWGIHRDRWIARTNGQWRGKCFHLMTSSRHDANMRLITVVNIRLMPWTIFPSKFKFDEK